MLVAAGVNETLINLHANWKSKDCRSMAIKYTRSRQTISMNMVHELIRDLKKSVKDKQAPIIPSKRVNLGIPPRSKITEIGLTQDEQLRISPLPPLLPSRPIKVGDQVRVTGTSAPLPGVEVSNGATGLVCLLQGKKASVVFDSGEKGRVDVKFLTLDSVASSKESSAPPSTELDMMLVEEGDIDCRSSDEDRVPTEIPSEGESWSAAEKSDSEAVIPADLPPLEHSDDWSDEDDILSVRWYIFPESLKDNHGKYHASFLDPARICCNKQSAKTSDLVPVGFSPPDPLFVCKSCLMAQPSLYRQVGLRP